MTIWCLFQVTLRSTDSDPDINTDSSSCYLATRQRSAHFVCFVRSDSDKAAARALRSVYTDITTVPLQRSRPRDMAYPPRV